MTATVLTRSYGYAYVLMVNHDLTVKYVNYHCLFFTPKFFCLKNGITVILYLKRVWSLLTKTVYMRGYRFACFIMKPVDINLTVKSEKKTVICFSFLHRNINYIPLPNFSYSGNIAINFQVSYISVKRRKTG